MLRLLQALPTDRELAGAPLAVFVFLLPDLLGDPFLEVKQVYLARRLRLTQPSVSRALGVLVRKHLLEPGPRAAGRPTFRVSKNYLASGVYT